MSEPLSPQEERAKLVLALRSQGITDIAVLNAMEAVPRHIFVPDVFRDRAYDNTALPIQFGQTISQPFVVAYMTQALRLERRHRVLELGTGSGYQAAVLAQLVRWVYSIERFPQLLADARVRFRQLGLTDIVTKVGDGTLGWPEVAPFDRIIATAAAETFPEHLLDQLLPGGIMVIPVGSDSGDQILIRATRSETGVRYEELLPVRFVPLVEGVARAPS